LVVPGVTLGADPLGRPAEAAARGAALRPQLVLPAGLPERPRVQLGRRQRLRAFDCDIHHGYPLRSSIELPPASPQTSASSGSRTWRHLVRSYVWGPSQRSSTTPWGRSCCTASITWFWPWMWASERSPPWVLTGSEPSSLLWPSRTQAPACPFSTRP